MTADERYIAALRALTDGARHMYRIAEIVDLGELREHLEACATLAPILEPSAYSQGGRLEIQEQRTFLEATITYVESLRTLDRRPT